MNFRPWPETLALIPLLNPTALTMPEWGQNWNTLNNLIKEFNDSRGREQPDRQQKPKSSDPWDTGAGAQVLPYDGVTPAHDNVPYVITNGVLKAWPAATCVIAGVGGAVLTLDITNRICYPNRLVIPVWSG